MTEPAAEVIAAATDAIYQEAALWDEQSHRLADCAREADSLTIDVYDLVIVNEFLTGYNEVTRTIARLCTQGTAVTKQIGQTLRVVADTYDEATDRASRQYARG
jgi:hypothetical protein